MKKNFTEKLEKTVVNDAVEYLLNLTKPGNLPSLTMEQFKNISRDFCKLLENQLNIK